MSTEILTICAVLVLLAYVVWAVNADRREERLRQKARDQERAKREQGQR